jgi:hypothetical protein
LKAVWIIILWLIQARDYGNTGIDIWIGFPVPSPYLWAIIYMVQAGHLDVADSFLNPDYSGRINGMFPFSSS